MVKKLLITGMLLVSLLASTGCGVNKVVLHPIEQTDIRQMKKGVSYTPNKNGWFVSDFYMKEVMQATID